MPPARVCVARIGAPHGVRGEVRLYSYTEDPTAIGRYGALESEDGSERFVIEALRQGKGHLIARLRGVTDRTAAARLTHMRLYVPRDRLPPTGEAESYYHVDLIGLVVRDRQGRRRGAVVAVQNFGAGDLLEIEPVGGGETVLLPFTVAIVPEIAIADGYVVIDPPEGLFDAGGPGRTRAEAEER